MPLLAGWLLVAWRTRRFVPTWLLGVTLGVVVRLVILSHYRWNELAFLAVALIFIGAVAHPVLSGVAPSTVTPVGALATLVRRPGLASGHGPTDWSSPVRRR